VIENESNMRNQQIKKVNRVFFSGQNEEKQKWLEQMAVEGWQLVSETSFMYSFQRVASENAGNQLSYRSILGKDFQKSMPLFQEPRQDWVGFLVEKNPEQNHLMIRTPARVEERQVSDFTKKRRWAAGALALFLILIILMTKIAIVSSANYLSLFKLQLFSSILLAGFSLIFGMVILLKSLFNIFAPECKNKK